jgi:hypothetical protein
MITKKPATEHDVPTTVEPATGGEVPHPPNPGSIEQGSKKPDVRDAGDKADRPSPKR